MVQKEWLERAERTPVSGKRSRSLGGAFWWPLIAFWGVIRSIMSLSAWWGGACRHPWYRGALAIIFLLPSLFFSFTSKKVLALQNCNLFNYIEFDLFFFNFIT
jgi:hypothetical protein